MKSYKLISDSADPTTVVARRARVVAGLHERFSKLLPSLAKLWPAKLDSAQVSECNSLTFHFSKPLATTSFALNHEIKHESLIFHLSFIKECLSLSLQVGVLKWMDWIANGWIKVIH
ncbi:hypothetical protein L195_g056066 [Trifolium pratense]|uniref:Uncharacterized protein n=1 Tax=Trifolium pratense TaxID=57577 RepID=A0A2K3K1K9_TRIPR|nr:hypothetical protein L195_g060060 [Trifolium pratense]PNX68257.1 hypothetical protein L195_g056066 [Trifolium pratense]